MVQPGIWLEIQNLRVPSRPMNRIFIILLFISFREREEERETKREREKERERSTCCSTYLCIHWLILTYALNWN